VTAIVLMLALTGMGLWLVFLQRPETTVQLYPMTYEAEIRAGAASNGLDPALPAAVILAESSYQPEAVSGANAQGLMQLLPSTARYCEQLLGVEQADLRLPEHNLRLGCGYLRYLLDRFGSERYALMAYNAGEGRVREWLSSGRTDIPYPETERYLRKIAVAKRAYLGRV
jgi:soluble lytic murein transglycosylase